MKTTVTGKLKTTPRPMRQPMPTAITLIQKDRTETKAQEDKTYIKQARRSIVTPPKLDRHGEIASVLAQGGKSSPEPIDRCPDKEGIVQHMTMMEVRGKDIGLPWSPGVDKQTQAQPTAKQEGNIWKML